MVLKEIHIATVSYACGAIDELKHYFRLGLSAGDGNGAFGGAQAPPGIQLNAATTRI